MSYKTESNKMIVINHNARNTVRKVFGAKVSEDHGKTWKVRALCDECIKSIAHHGD